MRYSFLANLKGMVIDDPVGTDLPSVEAAQKEAAQFAAELRREFPDEYDRTWTIVVRDENGALVFESPIFLISSGPD